MVYLRIFGGMKKEKQLVCWRDICVCPSIDHGQQPMKMHTEVTLLYKLLYLYYTIYYASVYTIIYLLYYILYIYIYFL